LINKNGTLQDLIENNRAQGKQMEVNQAIKFLKDICSGLNAFHKKQIPYAFRDLKVKKFFF